MLEHAQFYYVNPYINSKIALVIRHACKMLKNTDLLLLYNASDKNKKEIIQEEVKYHTQNSYVTARVLMAYCTASKACINICVIFSWRDH